MTYNEGTEKIKAALGREPKRAGFIGDGYQHGRGWYRGRRRYLIKWLSHRLNAHHATGRVHERVVGVGDDLASAIDNALTRRKWAAERAAVVENAVRGAGIAAALIDECAKS